MSGSTITYSITVTNLSVYTAGTYVITNQLAPGMVYLGSSDGGTQSGGFVRWVLTNLASHTARTVTMTAEPALQGSVIVVAAVRPYRADENELNNTATNTILAVCPFAGTVTNNAPLAHVGDERYRSLVQRHRDQCGLLATFSARRRAARRGRHSQRLRTATD
jgi:uncharacterized repeat protein (TIGR01451 family)